MRFATGLLLILLAALAAAPAAGARSYDVPGSLGAELRRVAASTDIPVRVPSRLALDFDGRVFASGTGTRHAWTLGLDGAPGCGNATACFLAQMTGEHGARPSFRRKVRLARGITGRYKPLTCGASCSPPQIQWVQRGVLYGIQAKLGAAGASAQRAALVRAANSAIRGRPR
jgi:hypothetical protein